MVAPVSRPISRKIKYASAYSTKNSFAIWSDSIAAIAMYFKTFLFTALIFIPPFKHKTAAFPFFSESNMKVLRASIADMEAGRGVVRKSMEELEAMENG